MEIKKIKDINLEEDRKEYKLVIKFNKNKKAEKSLDDIFELYYTDTPLTVKIEPQTKTKTLSANNYAWHLITEIARAITSTKEEVYKQLVKDYGVSAILSVKTENFELFVNDWNQNGLGYFVELIDSDEDTINAFFYKGISSYTGSEMHKFLEGVIYEAQQLDIEIRTPEELEKIRNSWKNDMQKNTSKKNPHQ